MKNFNNKEMMEAINKGFHGYEKVVDREIHYVYLNKSKRYQELVLKPHAKNFMHLCGVKYYSPKGKKLKVDEFYIGLKRGRLTPNGLRKADATTDLKIGVLPELNQLTYCDSLRIIDTPTTYAKNYFTHAIRTRRKIFVLGLECEGKSGHFVPKSLLNIKSDPRTKAIASGHQVHCIYSVDISTKNIQIICKNADFIEYEKSNTYAYKSAPQPA